MKIFFSNRLFNYAILILLVGLTACSSSNGFGTFLSANLVAVDSTNDRVFILQNQGTLFALTASTQVAIGDQPLIDEEEDSLFALIPSSVSNMAATSNSTSSSLFMQGAIADESSNLVLNRIRVLSFNGSEFSEAAFSPIILSDGDDATDESDNSFSDMVIDSDNGVLYITDSSAGLLYGISISDGSQTMTPVVIAGTPQGLSYDNGRLYVCNSSSVEIEQVVTVFDVTDFTIPTTIDLDTPCRELQAVSNSNGTVLFAKSSNSQVVLIHTVDTTTYAASSAIASATAGISDGGLIAGAGISSTVRTISPAVDANQIFAYLGEQDGNIGFISVAIDLGSFAFQTTSTSVTSYSDQAALISNGVTSLIYMTAESGAVAVITTGTTDIELID